MDIAGDYNRPAAAALIRGQAAQKCLEILRKAAIAGGKLLAHKGGMKLIPFGLTAALLTMGLVSAPASAQERDNHRREAAREAQQQGRAAQPAPSRSAERS